MGADSTYNFCLQEYSNDWYNLHKTIWYPTWKTFSSFQQSMQDIKFHITTIITLHVKLSMMPAALHALVVNQPVLLFWCYFQLHQNLSFSLSMKKVQPSSRRLKLVVCPINVTQPSFHQLSRWKKKMNSRYDAEWEVWFWLRREKAKSIPENLLLTLGFTGGLSLHRWQHLSFGEHTSNFHVLL